MPPIEASALALIFWALTGYLAGSIPFGLLLSRSMNLGDLRQIGSGSTGATNVLRTGSKKAAALTLLLDGAKGAVIVLIARALVGEDAAQIAALGAMIGHCYSIFLRFTGGKGVATFLGLALALSWPVGVGCCAAWLVGAALFRRSSMASLVSASSSTFFVIFLTDGAIFLLCVVLTLLIFWRHRDNIKRIRAGTEPKIGEKA